MTRTAGLLFVLFWATSVARSDDSADSERPDFYLEDGDCVVMLGGTLIEREQVYGEWELMLTCLYADADFTVRNLGWSGDTVWAESRGIFDPPEVGYQRMIDQIKDLNPTVVILAYGHNEAWAGEEGLDAFITQYEKLIDDIQAATEAETRYLILLPHPHLDLHNDLPDPSLYNSLIPTYVAAIEQMANTKEIPQISLHQNRPMRQISTWSQLYVYAQDESTGLSSDGVQFNERSYGFLAQELASQFAALSHSASTTFAFVETHPSSPDFLGFDFEVIALDPVSGAFTARCTRNNLAQRGLGLLAFPGARVMSLRIDGEAVASISADDTNTVAVDGPDFEQREALRQAIIRKNELYFHRWRPENVTYLFGFRAHEQGNNAVEIPQFDPLIEEQEALIRELKHPVEHVWELVPAE